MTARGLLQTACVLLTLLRTHAQSGPTAVPDHIMRGVPTRPTAAAQTLPAEAATLPVDMPSLPDLVRMVARATAVLEEGTLCGRHSADYLDALANFTLWAVQMYDASVKIPSGVLYGSVYQLGHFDQCVAVKTSGIQGQYCLPEITFSPAAPRPMPVDGFSLDFNPDESAWLKLQFAGDESKIRRDKVYWALCVPSSCSPQQLQRAVNKVLQHLGPKMGTEMTATLASDYCTVAVEKGIVHTTTVLYVSIVTVLLSLVIAGTYYDVQFGKENDIFHPEKEKSKLRQLLRGFSIERNMKSLMNAENTNKSLDLFHFMRTFFMLSIISGHRLIAYCGFPVFDGESEDVLFRHPASMIVANGAIYVDVFFCMGGFTMAFLMFEEFNKSIKFFKLFLAIINRFLRLTPLYAIILMFEISILPYLGSGPFWKSTVLKEQTRCETYWWANLLYVNNYIDPANMCMFQSWYLSVDFHLFIICLFLGYIIWRWPRLGWTLTGLLTFLSVAVPFATIYYLNLDPLVKPFPRYLKAFRDNSVFQSVYVPTQNRAAPYLMGMIGGIIAFRGKSSSFKLSKVATHLLFFSGWGVGFIVLFSAYVFFIPGRPTSTLEGAIYGSLHRLAIGILVSLFGLSTAIGDADKLKAFMSSKVFVVLSRLSYAAFLVHSIPQLYDQGSLRNARHVDIYSGIWIVVADYVTTFFFSLILSLLIEAPFRNITKILFDMKR